MNYGLYIAASGASSQMHRQEVLTNNMANINTVGFRPHTVAIRARDVVRNEDSLGLVDSNAMLEKLGGGVVPVATRLSESQGPLERTGRDLDVAIDGKGFLVVSVGDGDEGLRLTRDGRLAVNEDGVLVTSADGAVVMGDGGEIEIDPSMPVEIASDGSVSQNGGVVGRLQIATVDEAWRLVSEGKGLHRAADGRGLDLMDAPGRVVQGAVEGSGVDAIRTLMGVTTASRSAQTNIEMISMIDENMGMAVSRLGRVG